LYQVLYAYDIEMIYCSTVTGTTTLLLPVVEDHYPLQYVYLYLVPGTWYQGMGMNSFSASKCWKYLYLGVLRYNDAHNADGDT
jgi:hypothetical protein